MVVVEHERFIRCPIRGGKGNTRQEKNGNERDDPRMDHHDAACSLSERVAQLTLTGERQGVPWVRVPLVFTIVDVAVTVGVHHAVCCVVRVEFEVVFPARCHPVVVVVLVVDLRSVVPFVTVGVVRDRIRAVLEFLEIRVILQVVVETNAIGGVGVDVTLAVGGILIAGQYFLTKPLRFSPSRSGSSCPSGIRRGRCLHRGSITPRAPEEAIDRLSTRPRSSAS